MAKWSARPLEPRPGPTATTRTRSVKPPARIPTATPRSSTYDADGNVLTSTNALGNTSTYSYNSFDEQTCAAEPSAADPCSSLVATDGDHGRDGNDHPAVVGPAQVRHLHRVRHRRQRDLPDDRRLRAGFGHRQPVAHHL